MDLLDNYKKAWENQPEAEHKISRNEIFKMMHAKSSSIVKWIFIIGLCEFISIPLTYFLIDIEKAIKVYEDLGLLNFVIYSSFITFPVLLYFLYKFYTNYKNISVIDDTKILMIKILKTRKTVKNYVIFNLSLMTLFLIILSIAGILHFEHEIENTKFIIIILVIVAIIIASVVSYWLLYQLLYGILLKKLNKNYKELAKLDELN